MEGPENNGNAVTRRQVYYRALYRRQIEATDRQIDALVYELYGLTEDEIAIVEAAAA